MKAFFIFHLIFHVVSWEEWCKPRQLRRPTERFSDVCVHSSSRSIACEHRVSEVSSAAVRACRFFAQLLLSLYASQPVTVTGRGSRRSHRHFLASELLQSFPLRMEGHCSNTLSGHTTQKYHHWHDKYTNIVGREKSTSPRLARRLISKTVIPREPLIQM